MPYRSGDISARVISPVNGQPLVYSDDLSRWVNAEQLQLPTRSRMPLATLVSDDEYAGDLELIPMFASRGKSATLAITTDHVGQPGYLTWSQIEAAQTAGMEIALHSKTHSGLVEGVNDDDASLAAEYLTALDELRSHGLRVTTWVWVGGANTKNARKWARRYFKGACAASLGPETDPRLMNQYRVKRVDITTYNLSTANALVDAAKANNYWIVWMNHSIENAQFHWDTVKTWLPQHLDYCIAQGVEIVNFDRGLDLWGHRWNPSDDRDGAYAITHTGEPVYPRPSVYDVTAANLRWKHLPVGFSLLEEGGACNASNTGFNLLFKDKAKFAGLSIGQGSNASRLRAIIGDYTDWLATLRQFICDIELDLAALPSVATEIPAHSTLDIPTNQYASGQIDGKDTVTANPKSQIESGIVWNAYVSPSTYKVILRLANVTASPITVQPRAWRFIVQCGNL
jgi:hypothetical protein